jgi:hypothetical protein
MALFLMNTGSFSTGLCRNNVEGCIQGCMTGCFGRRSGGVAGMARRLFRHGETLPPAFFCGAGAVCAVSVLVPGPGDGQCLGSVCLSGPSVMGVLSLTEVLKLKRG